MLIHGIALVIKLGTKNYCKLPRGNKIKYYLDPKNFFNRNNNI